MSLVTQAVLAELRFFHCLRTVAQALNLLDVAFPTVPTGRLERLERANHVLRYADTAGSPYAPQGAPEGSRWGANTVAHQRSWSRSQEVTARANPETAPPRTLLARTRYSRRVKRVRVMWAQGTDNGSVSRSRPWLMLATALP